MTEDLHWWLTKDGDTAGLALYERHYSCYRYADGRKRKLFCGPGQKIVLRTWAGDALFVWRKFRDGSGEEGINCAIFRNESPTLSSVLIRQADAIADFCWPGERHYTYVNAETVQSRNPGYCFLQAGWRKCPYRTRRHGLLVLERVNGVETKEFDITCEQYREYDFGGRVYRIEAPVKLFYRAGGETHRVVDSEGKVHCVPAPGNRGCVLRWKAKDETQPVKF